MEIFGSIIGALGQIPDWAPLLLLPALDAVYVLFSFFFGGRKAYPYVAAGLWLASFSVLCCKSLQAAAVFSGLYALYAAALRLLYFIPARKKKEGKDARMYRKFASPLAQTPAPPKICRFEEERPAAESETQLRYADELIARLKKASLAASDRLELDVLCHALNGYRKTPLSEGETHALNDCLASVLKMTAKYKL